jgi:hypothetical protein
VARAMAADGMQAVTLFGVERLVAREGALPVQ